MGFEPVRVKVVFDHKFAVYLKNGATIAPQSV